MILDLFQGARFSVPSPLRRFLSFAGLGLAWFGSTQAQQTRQSLEPMVITANRSPTQLGHTTSSVSVIDREDLLLRQCVLLADALTMLPGLAVVDAGMPGTLATVMMRGTTTKDSALWVNGRPQMMNLAGSFNLEMLGVDQVDRIEVLRGPASSLYGGRSMGGVIHVITKRPEPGAPVHGEMLVEAGSYGLLRQSLQASGADERMDWVLNLGLLEMEGQRINSAVSNAQGGLNVGYKLDDEWRFEFELRGLSNEVGVPGTVRKNDPDEQLTSELVSFSPRLIWQPDDSVSHTLTYSHMRQSQVSEGVSGFLQSNNHLDLRSDWIEYQLTLDQSRQLRWVGGASLQDQSFSRFNDDSLRTDIDLNQTQAAVFGQMQWQPDRLVDVVAGLRHDFFSDFRSATTMRLGLGLNIEATATRLHAQYANAYTPPTPQDLTPVFGGDPGLLEPETSRGMELGLRQSLVGEALGLEVTAFRNNLRNTYQYLPPLYLPEAIGQATAQGLEVGLKARWDKRVAFSLAYTFLEATNDTELERLVRRPSHQTAAQVLWRPRSDLTFGLGGVWSVGREDYLLDGSQGDLGDYLDLRLTAAWQINRRFSLHSRVENLLGDQFERIAGFPALDTGVSVGLRLSF